VSFTIRTPDAVADLPLHHPASRTHTTIDARRLNEIEVIGTVYGGRWFAAATAPLSRLRQT